MKKLPIILFFGMAILLSQNVYALDGTALLKEVDNNLTPSSFESYRKIINIEPGGKNTDYVLYTVKKGRDKMVGLFLAPASEKGRSTLRVGDNMWLYIPSVGRPIRITSLQSVTGGIFNNSDIMRLDYSEEYNVSGFKEENGLYLLLLTAKNKGVAYGKLKMWVDKKYEVPIKIECYTVSNMLIKTLYFKDIKNFGKGIIRPSVIETDSPLYKGYKSVMIFANIKKRKFPDEVFSINYMSKIEDLRR